MTDSTTSNPRSVFILNQEFRALVENDVIVRPFNNRLTAGLRLIEEAKPHMLNLAINTAKDDRRGFVGILDQGDREDPHQRDIFPDGSALALIVHLRVSNFFDFEQDEIDAIVTAIEILDRTAEWENLSLLLNAMWLDDKRHFPFEWATGGLYEWALSERAELGVDMDGAKNIANRFTENICALIASEEELEEKAKAERELNEKLDDAYHRGQVAGYWEGRQYERQSIVTAITQGQFGTEYSIPKRPDSEGITSDKIA